MESAKLNLHGLNTDNPSICMFSAKRLRSQINFHKYDSFDL